MDSVAPLTEQEKAKYINIDFDPEEYRYTYLYKSVIRPVIEAELSQEK